MKKYLLRYILIIAFVFIQFPKVLADDADAYFDSGLAYIYLGRYKEAIEPLKQAISVSPDDEETHFNLGAIYNFLNDRNSALEQYMILKDRNSELANKLYSIIYK